MAAQPGPWFKSSFVMTKRDWASLHEPELQIVCSGPRGSSSDVIAAVWCDDDHDEEDTARLIAAAPAMYEALKQAAETFRKYEALHQSKGSVEGAQKAAANSWCARQCEAAIALADGEGQP